MKSFCRKLFSLLGLLAVLNGQGCIDNTGNPVGWWVKLKVPPKVGQSGYAYFDSSYTSSDFNYFSLNVDSPTTALANTFEQINNQSLDTVAWNDEHPNGKTSSTKAHSKGVIAYSYHNKVGFFLSHSLPRYPAFENNKINYTVPDSENIFGQDIFCLSLSMNELNKLAYRLMIITPYIYQSNIHKTSATINLAELGAGKTLRVPQLYQVQNFNPTAGILVKGVFKSGFDSNCSIFEDALLTVLKQSLTAETWGRPIQEPYCSQYQVNNVQTISVGGVTWTQTQDHSKWVVGSTYACFGDMNRMTSQWKRGGAFYCLNRPNLVQALKSVIQDQDSC